MDLRAAHGLCAGLIVSLTAKIVQGERNAKQKNSFCLSIPEPQSILPERSDGNDSASHGQNKMKSLRFSFFMSWRRLSCLKAT